MRPSAWHPPIELSSFEQIIIARIKHAKLFVFLRHHRHELFDDAFQEELAALYAPSSRGQPPVAPAQLARASILQAYTGVSDDEVIEATLMDRRWQLALDCLDTEQAPFSKGTFVAFRKRLIDAQMDRRLIERTIELASFSQEFGPRALRAALDSSPFWGAGRVEDTYNLIGHALRKVIQIVAEQQEKALIEVGKEAGAEMVCTTSLKAALGRDWDQPTKREEALALVVNVLHVVETWVHTLPQEEAVLVQPSLEIAEQVKQQDVEVNEQGKARLIKGVAKDRHGSREDAEMPEASVTEAISADLEQQPVALKELHIDRAYLSSHLVRSRSDELEVYCKAWPVREGKHFHKQAFTLDWDRQIIRCPAEQEMPFQPGGVVHFPQETCTQCPLKAQCTTSAKGRSVSIHPDEALLIELREHQQTPQGRARLRERAAVEHSLAHVSRWQGRRARYRGVRKNLFDLRRHAVVHNLHVLARTQQRLSIL